MTLLTAREASAFTRLSMRTLERMRLVGDGPAYCKLRRTIRYKKEDLERWLTDRTVRSTSETTR
jgi:Helix-turn-helix domain